MPRIARALGDNCYYHIINRGNGRQQIFHKDEDYAAFLGLMQQARVKHPVRLHAWCLMPNHFHMLVQPEHGDELNKYMQWLMTSHVRRYHAHYKTSGHVWQGRYKSFIIQSNEHLLTVARYIEGNPVRAGLSPTAVQWLWSSHTARTAGSDGLQPDTFLLSLPDDWTAYVDMPLTDREIEKLRKCVNRQAPFGEEDWQHELCREMGMESTLRPIGWPKGKKRGANK